MPTKSSHQKAEEKELAYDIKFLLVVLLLFLVYPVGLILMWVWMGWPTWVKLLLSLPILLVLFMVFAGMMLFAGLWRNGIRNQQWNYPPMMRYYRSGYFYRAPMMQQQGAPVTIPPTEIPTVTY